jgi:hypothetical protein
MIAAAAVVGLAGTVAVQSPAQAVEPPPGCESVIGHNESAGNFISAFRFWDCGTYEEPFPVSIQRYQSPGVWQTVASGMGDTIYFCNGTGYNVYRTTGTPEFAILCG